jgi:hypothetical protein
MQTKKLQAVRDVLGALVCPPSSQGCRSYRHFCVANFMKTPGYTNEATGQQGLFLIFDFNFNTI